MTYLEIKYAIIYLGKHIIPFRSKIKRTYKDIHFLFQLLSKPKFSVLEKIKTIGSTYMVAAGLQPGKEGGRSVSKKDNRRLKF